MKHDLRRASCFETKDEQKIAEKECLQDIAVNVAGTLAAIVASRSRKVQQMRFLLSVLSIFRFYFALQVVEAGYRFHLVKFGIRAPVCFKDPWNSETIGEFWTRWNLAIAQQLRACKY